MSQVLTGRIRFIEGFYGVDVAETGGGASFLGIEKINFNINDFYVTQNDPNTDEVIINFR